MKKRVRCPLCGMLIWESQVHKFYNLDVYEMERYVRAQGSGGFRYTESEDQGLVALVRAKIKALYERFFDNKIQLRVPIIPSILLQDNVDLSLNVPIMIKSEVKMVG